MNNSNTKSWIAIIISIIIAAVSISFGILQASARNSIQEAFSRLESHEVFINEMRTHNAIIMNELQHMNKSIEDLKIILKEH